MSDLGYALSEELHSLKYGPHYDDPPTSVPETNRTTNMRKNKRMSCLTFRLGLERHSSFSWRLGYSIPLHSHMS